MPRKLCIETIYNVGLYAAKNLTVVTVYASVVVGVLIFQVARLRCLSVDGWQYADILAILHDADEAETVERTESLATTENLLVVSTLDNVVRTAHIGNLVVVIGNVG